MGTDKPVPFSLPFAIKSSMQMKDMVKAIQSNFDHLAGAFIQTQTQTRQTSNDVLTFTTTAIQADQLAEVLDTLTITQRDTSTDALTVVSAGPSYTANLLTILPGGAAFVIFNSAGHMNTTQHVRFEGAEGVQFSAYLGAADLELKREAASLAKLDNAAGGPGSLHITGNLTVDGIAGGAGLNHLSRPGPPGFDGLDGLDGTDGAPGSPGPRGFSGLQGPPGFDGDEGAEGIGTPGPPGVPGAAGATGPPGATGLQGFPGFPGYDGEDGLEGFGAPGPQGPAGVSGSPGAPGAGGASGPPGPAGLDAEEHEHPYIIPGPPGPVGAAGSGANVVQGTVDFGFASGNQGDVATVTVAAAWVTGTSKIVCNPAALATADHEAEDAVVEELSAYATNLVAGVGFDIEAYAPQGTWGRYLVNAMGV